MDLTDAQWSLLDPLIPVGKAGPGRRGCPPKDRRAVLNGILWILRTGAQRFAAYGIELIAPNRKNRNKTQDGRPLCRYRRSWKVERFFAWLNQFRRLVNRWEYHADNFLALLQLGCIVILLRHF